LRGKYDHFYDLIADGFEEKQREIYLKKMLDPGRYPYYMGKNQVKLYEGYMDGILMLHGISNRQYDELSPEKRKAFQIEDIRKRLFYTFLMLRGADRVL